MLLLKASSASLLMSFRLAARTVLKEMKIATIMMVEDVSRGSICPVAASGLTGRHGGPVPCVGLAPPVSTDVRRRGRSIIAGLACFHSAPTMHFHRHAICHIRVEHMHALID